MASEQKPFVHLRVHSAYSLLEGALTVENWRRSRAPTAAPALALTDTDNLFGALEFSEALAKDGVQPIIGMTLSLAFASLPAPAPGGEHQRPQADGRIVLLARTRKAMPISCIWSPRPIHAASEDRGRRSLSSPISPRERRPHRAQRRS